MPQTPYRVYNNNNTQKHNASHDNAILSLALRQVPFVLLRPYGAALFPHYTLDCQALIPFCVPPL